MKACHSIAPRPFLRYLGLLIPIVVGLPSAIALPFLAAQPSVAVANWPGVLMTLFFASVGGVSGWRWWRLGANVDDSEIVMRGIFQTARMPIGGFQQISKVWSLANNENSSDQSYRHLFMDSEGATIEELPAGLEICVDFKAFLSHLEQVAARNRKKLGASPKRNLSNLPVEQWTLQDIEKYEQDH